MTGKEFIKNFSLLFNREEKELQLFYNYAGSDFFIKAFSLEDYLADYVYPYCTPEIIISEITRKIEAAELAYDPTNYSDDLRWIIAELKQDAQSTEA